MLELLRNMGGSGSRCSVTTGWPSSVVAHVDGAPDAGRRPVTGFDAAVWDGAGARPGTGRRGAAVGDPRRGSSSASCPSPKRPACASRCTRTTRRSRRVRGSAGSSARSTRTTASSSWHQPGQRDDDVPGERRADDGRSPGGDPALRRAGPHPLRPLPRRPRDAGALRRDVRRRRPDRHGRLHPGLPRERASTHRSAPTTPRARGRQLDVPDTRRSAGSTRSATCRASSPALS